MPASGMALPPTYSLQQAPVFDMGLVLSGAARTSTLVTADVNTLNFKGITVILDVSSAGTSSLTVKVDGKDFSNSGNYFNLLTSSAITANGTTAHIMYPGITASTGANANTQVSSILPVYVRIQVVHGNGNPATYTVGAILTT